VGGGLGRKRREDGLHLRSQHVLLAEQNVDEGVAVDGTDVGKEGRELGWRFRVT
jgi:hypothetical protein